MGDFRGGGLRLALCGFALMMPFETFAQGVDEIIVTAQRREQALQDVPVSVSVATGASLAKQGIISLADLSTRQPNLRIVQGSSADQLHIRGTGSGYNGGFEQSVATFVDGVYRSRARSTRLALFDIERVEVLKGPQTTFFGANAIAGALNITTKHPADHFELNALALYSPSDGEYNTELGVTVPLSDSLSLRAAGRFSGMDGYVNFDRDVDGPHLNDRQGRISLAWNPSDRIEIFARFDAARMRDRGAFPMEIYGCPPKGLPATGICAAAIAQFGPIDDKIDYHSDGAFSGRFNLNMREGLINSRIAFESFDLILSTAYIDQNLRAIVDTAPFPGLSVTGTGTRVPVNTGEDYQQFSQEIRLQSTADGPLQYMIGAYYEHGDLFTDTYTGLYLANLAAAAPAFFPNRTPIAIDWNFHQKSQTMSGFASLTYNLTDALSISGGLRYSRVRKKASRSALMGTGGRLYVTPEDFVAAPEAAQLLLARAAAVDRSQFAAPRRVDSEWMPSVNLRYEFSPDVMAYASFSKGFKAGGYGFVSPDTFEPETVKAYEAGLKAYWFGRRLLTNIAVFRSDYDNLQESQNITTVAGIPSLVIGNAAKSRAEGVEFSGQWKVSSALNLFTEVAYLDSKYVSFPNASCNPIQAAGLTSCVQDLSGRPRPFASKWSGSAGGDVTLPLGNSLQFEAGAVAYFTSSFYSQSVLGAPVRQPAYGKLDLRAGLGAPDGNWKFSIIAKNVLNQKTASFRNYASGTSGTGSVIADRPRSIALQLSYSM
ncbi:TonB-dependent receptor [Sphingobium sp. 15-1]|uniref:TonB-dependent receptor n=1 Tax=Sphingobium sp. 15-1 TaxID=2729616 RepID=UPI00159BF3B6|nr:TonB-dependent receptor [Sphingobium sp. 15-1]